MTLGQERVRLSFNPSGNIDVVNIKQRAADCIDWCAGRKISETSVSVADQEVNRLLELAMTAFEEAAMWAVKAITAGK
jgi:hypothetical protein